MAEEAAKSSGNATGFDYQTFDEWCVLDLFGRVKTAGRVTVAVIGPASLLRVDVPDVDGYRTEFYGAGAIYSMRPVSEEIARAYVQTQRTSPPVNRYEVSSLLKQIAPSTHAEEAFDYDED